MRGVVCVRRYMSGLYDFIGWGAFGKIGRFKLYINRLDKYSIENIKLALRGKVVIEAVEEIL